MTNKRLAFFAAVTAFAAILSLMGATFAWFTTNAQVNTSQLRARTASDVASLLIAESANGPFNSTEKTIVQINDNELLTPVSTSNLRSFFVMRGDNPKLLGTEEGYFHGKLWFRVDSEVPGTVLGLWLDGSDAVVTNATGDILNAARLGIRIDGETRIYYLSEEHNADADQTCNTYVGGVLQPDGVVIMSETRATEDPAAPLTDSMVQRSDGGTTIGTVPIAYLESGRVYEMDIYFYLEGCDPDCSDSVSYQGLDLTLNFYGVNSEGVR